MCVRWKAIFLYNHITENPCKEQLSDLFRKDQDIWNIPVIVLWHLFSSKYPTKIHPEGLCWHWPTSQSKNELNVMKVTKKHEKINFSLEYSTWCAWKRWSRTLRISMAHQHMVLLLLLLEKCSWARPWKLLKHPVVLVWFCFGSNYGYLTGLSRE